MTTRMYLHLFRCKQVNVPDARSGHACTTDVRIVTISDSYDPRFACIELKATNGPITCQANAGVCAIFDRSGNCRGS